MDDLHGNTIDLGDMLYILDSSKIGSKSKRLLYGKVTEITKNKCKVFVYENSRTYSKTSANIIKPME